MEKVNGGEMRMKYVGSRDMQASSAVAIMAQLGRFEAEFIVYGSAIQENDGKIYYYATTNQEKLYQCIKNARMEERYFMPIVQYVKRMKVPADLEDEWLAKTKLELIQEMKKQYESFIIHMQPVFQRRPNNNAEGVLKDYQMAIDGYFDDTLLQLFWGLVEESYAGKILSREAFLDFKRWYDNVRHQMSDDPVFIDNITRDYYGFVYRDKNGKRETFLDAQKVNVLDAQNKKKIQGYVVAPIIKKQFSFKNFGEMPRIRQEFMHWLLETQSEDYMKTVELLKNMPGVIDETEFQDIKEMAGDCEYVLFAISYYKAVFNQK